MFESKVIAFASKFVNSDKSTVPIKFPVGDKVIPVGNDPEVFE